MWIVQIVKFSNNLLQLNIRLNAAIKTRPQK